MHTMAQKVGKRAENEFLALKFLVSNGVQNTNLELKCREREQKLEILDSPRRQASSEKRVKGVQI